MRVGLVGWAVKTGNGQMNRDMWDHGLVQAWLAPRHPVLGWHESIGVREMIACDQQVDRDTCRDFLDSIEVLLFLEHNDYILGFDLVEEARRRGLLVVCIPMMEWLPFRPWVANVDLMWAVTGWTHEQLQKIAHEMARQGMPCRWRTNICGGRWGVDLERFPCRQRSTVKRYLFLNGNGGVLGRKGADVVARAATLAPEVPIIFRTQTRDIPPLPSNVELDVSNPAEKFGLYEEGDVMLAPSRWEGYGHQLYEAQACGLPILTTDAEPMIEARPMRRIECTRREVDLCGRGIPAYEPSPYHLAMLMREFWGATIAEHSAMGRTWIEQNHDLHGTMDQLCQAMQERLPVSP